MQESSPQQGIKLTTTRLTTEPPGRGTYNSTLSFFLHSLPTICVFSTSLLKTLGKCEIAHDQ